MNAAPDIAVVASAIGDQARARMLTALLDGRALPASEMAASAGLAAQAATWHLQRLVDGGLVVVERRGRHRYFRLASSEVATALEALEAIAPRQRVRSLRESYATVRLRLARTCYDHLAGHLGVALTGALVGRGALLHGEGGFVLTSDGEAQLTTLGVNVAGARASRRRFAPECLDWSERVAHVGGALGAAMFAHACASGWVAPRPGERALDILPAGREALWRVFGVAPSANEGSAPS